MSSFPDPNVSYQTPLNSRYASEEMRSAVKGILTCYQRKYPKTFMRLAPHPYSVYWGEDTILKGSVKYLVF